MGQLQLGELRLLAIVFATTLLLVAVGWRLLAPRGSSLRTLLTAAEWELLGKLLAIAVIALVLLQTKISLEFPVEQFIYGRF